MISSCRMATDERCLRRPVLFEIGIKSRPIRGTDQLDLVRYDFDATQIDVTRNVGKSESIRPNPANSRFYFENSGRTGTDGYGRPRTDTVAKIVCLAAEQHVLARRRTRTNGSQRPAHRRTLPDVPEACGRKCPFFRGRPKQAQTLASKRVQVSPGESRRVKVK
jgi:hypothetical protein